jgi:hypothetical protein
MIHNHEVPGSIPGLATAKRNTCKPKFAGVPFCYSCESRLEKCAKGEINKWGFIGNIVSASTTYYLLYNGDISEGNLIQDGAIDTKDLDPVETIPIISREQYCHDTDDAMTCSIDATGIIRTNGGTGISPFYQFNNVNMCELIKRGSACLANFVKIKWITIKK